MASLPQASESRADSEEDDPLESLGRHVLKIYGPQAVTSEDAAVLKALESADYRRKEELAAQRANKQHKEIEELKRKLANTQVHVNDDQVYSSASRSDESDCQAGAAEAGGSHEAVLKQVEIENTSRLKEEAKQRENEAAEQIRRLQEQLAAAMQKAELGAAEG